MALFALSTILPLLRLRPDHGRHEERARERARERERDREREKERKKLKRERERKKERNKERKRERERDEGGSVRANLGKASLFKAPSMQVKSFSSDSDCLQKCSSRLRV